MTSQSLLVRIGCALLAVSSTIVGVWAAFAPRSFYDHFPGGGHAWVSADGPYNQHLVRDVGQLNLALAVLLWAVVVAGYRHRNATRTLLAAYLVQGALHLTYHAAHLNLYGTTDAVGNMVSLGLGVAIPVALIILLAGRPAIHVEESRYP